VAEQPRERAQSRGNQTAPPVSLEDP